MEKEKDLKHLLDDVKEKHIKQINTYDFEIRFNEFKKIQVRQHSLKLLKEMLFMFGSNKSIVDYLTAKSEEGASLMDTITAGIHEQTESFTKILNMLLGTEKTLDEHLDDYTLEEFEILLLALLKINGESFLLKKIQNLSTNPRVDFKSLMAKALEIAIQNGVITK
jgi:hypothetical protein